jgi:hypothetical protein
MTLLTARNITGWNSASLLGTAALLLCGAIPSFAQTPMSMPQQATAGSGDQSRQLADQVAELRAQVARLQAAQTTGNGGRKAAAPAKMGAGSMGKGMAMGDMAMPMPMDQGEMGSMPAGGGMPMGDKSEMGMPSTGGKGNMAGPPAAAMGMCCMGDKGGMPAGGSAGMGAAAPGGGGMAGMNTPTSAMPGQAGASHMYHIGSTGFFLNHSQHITLTKDLRSTG